MITATDLLRQGSSGHVVEFPRALQAVRDEAERLERLLVVEEEEEEMSESGQSRDERLVEVHEQFVLEAAEALQHVRIFETEMTQTERPQTPLHVSQIRTLHTRLDERNKHRQ